jgi:3-hydroxy-D-aspartate aldolase
VLTSEEIDTPALVLDLDAVERNIARMAAECAAGGIALRPHAKTHKSPWFASRQSGAGAAGICTAKIGEAEVMARAGIDDILLTTELTRAKLDRFLDLLELARVTAVVESADAVADLGRAAALRGVEIPVLVDVNVGQDRCGVDSPEAAGVVARACASTEGVRLVGVQGYEGHLQHVLRADERRRLAFEAYDRLAAAVEAVRAVALDLDWVTTAGTGTYRYAIEHGLATEAQAGSYAVMDARYGAVEGVDFDAALFVVSGVVGRNRPGRLIVDAGMKTLSTDDGMPAVLGHADATYETVGDEHGRVTGLDATTERVWLVPSHCDTTINLHDRYTLVRGGRVVGTLPIAARGRVT